MSDFTDRLGVSIIFFSVIFAVSILIMRAFPDYERTLSINFTRIGQIETSVIVTQHAPWSSQIIIGALLIFSFILAFTMVLIWKVDTK